MIFSCFLFWEHILKECIIPWLYNSIKMNIFNTWLVYNSIIVLGWIYFNTWLMHKISIMITSLCVCACVCVYLINIQSIILDLILIFLGSGIATFAKHSHILRYLFEGLLHSTIDILYFLTFYEVICWVYNW